jgi:hypothetical protein
MGILDKLGGMDMEPKRPTKERIASYGARPDGTPKGAGYFGEIPHKGKPGTFSTELTIGVNFDGKETNIPLIVPTLLIAGRESHSIILKAVEHAKKRMKEGKSLYAEEGEYYTYPKE